MFSQTVIKPQTFTFKKLFLHIDARDPNMSVVIGAHPYMGVVIGESTLTVGGACKAPTMVGMRCSKKTLPA
jgi:hypothetical protein